MNITIKYNTLGADSGPYILTVSSGIIIPNTATRSELLAGKIFTLSGYTGSTIYVTITSTGVCPNSDIINVISDVPNLTSECVNIGSLYNYYAVSDSRKITSSDDWVIPTIFDFNSLTEYLGSWINAPYITKREVAVGILSWISFGFFGNPGYTEQVDYGSAYANTGGRLKGSAHWSSPNEGAYNTIYFNGLGSGYRDNVSGNFYELNQTLSMWTSTPYNTNPDNVMFGKSISYLSSNFYSGNLPKKSGNSVRLLRTTFTTDPITTTTGKMTFGTYVGNDNKVYPTVKIGPMLVGSYDPGVRVYQEWITSNLNETKYRDKSIIPEVTDNNSWINLTTGARCVYNNNNLNLDCTYSVPQTIKIPEGFSLNYDGVNDYFEVKGLEFYPFNAMYIFTRSGQLVYEAGNYGYNFWNGYLYGDKVRGKVPTGAYYYVLIIKDQSDNVLRTLTGFVYAGY